MHIRKLGRPPDPQTIKTIERIKGVWWNDQTGNYHQTLRVRVVRNDGSMDSGVYGQPGDLPCHPTTDKPLADTPEHRGLRINPKPMGALVKGVVRVTLPKAHPADRVRTRSAGVLAWERQTGEQLPTGTRVRHMDGDVWNNRLDNLAVVRPAGAHQAATWVNGKVVTLGRFHSRSEADAAVATFRASVGLPPVRPYSRKTDNPS